MVHQHDNPNRHTFDGKTCRNPKAKQDTRDRTLRNVQAMAQWHRKTKKDPNSFLTEDWIDLCGKHDETLKMLLAIKALQPGFGMYKGVNRNSAIIRENQDFFAKEIADGLCDFRCGEWNDVIQSDWAAKATIFTFDGFDSVAQHALPDTLGPTIDHAKDRRKRYGQALIYLNMCRPFQADLTDYKSYLLEALGVDIQGNQIHEYTSKSFPMVSMWFRLGF